MQLSVQLLMGQTYEWVEEKKSCIKKNKQTSTSTSKRIRCNKIYDVYWKLPVKSERVKNSIFFSR